MEPILIVSIGKTFLKKSQNKLLIFIWSQKFFATKLKDVKIYTQNKRHAEKTFIGWR